MKFLNSFLCAGRGVFEAAKGRNFRIMLCAAAVVIFFAAMFYDFSAGEWAVLLLTCGAVLGFEALNTGIEKLADKVCAEKDELVGKCKDCAAGGVLLCSIFAAAVGVKLFWNEKAFSDIASYFSEPLRAVILAAAIVLMVLFVVLPKAKDKK